MYSGTLVGRGRRSGRYFAAPFIKQEIMKTSILITDGVKQIMFTPENENEKMALKMISPYDDIHTVVKQGHFSDRDDVFGADIYMCQGGYLRAEDREESVMFVLTPKKKEK